MLVAFVQATVELYIVAGNQFLMNTAGEFPIIGFAVGGGRCPGPVFYKIQKANYVGLPLII